MRPARKRNRSAGKAGLARLLRRLVRVGNKRSRSRETRSDASPRLRHLSIRCFGPQETTIIHSLAKTRRILRAALVARQLARQYGFLRSPASSKRSRQGF
jgi:hypothetical protein